MSLRTLESCVQRLNIACALGMFVLNLSILIQSSKTSKRHQAAWRIECELGVISDPECPVDGSWTTWESWSACHGSCGDVGHRRRTRQCINPPPSEDGLPCNGPDEEIEPCHITNCTSQDYRKLIQGDPARMNAFYQLEAIPSLMERCLQTECRFDAIENALASDNTWLLDSENLWNALQCVKHNLGCSVIGEWGSWGAWSACGARCGHGLRWRLRRCDTPPPSNSHLICNGLPLQAEQCEGDQCTGVVKDSDSTGGSWSAWGDWSPCSERCCPGVRRRRRFCLEKPGPRNEGSWGTSCVGQHDQFEVCKNEKCLLDGGWSGWSAWGPCSQTCGVGKRFRTRSCTRPVPAGGGKTCVGPRIEVGTCYLDPCEAYTHVIVLLNGESFLQYKFEKKRSTLFHFYTRFMPLSPHGTLVRRGTVHSPHVRLSMQNWHICLDAGGTSSSCTIQRICSPSVLNPAAWHSALITITNQAATLRLDDAVQPIKASFPCDPELPVESLNIVIGERFHGQIQEMVLNFIPLDLVIDRNQRSAGSDFYPTSISNVAYEKPALEEAYLSLHDDQYLRIPCFAKQDEWKLELTVKSKRDSGILLFMINDKSDYWLHMGLQNMRLKLKVGAGKIRSETSSSTDCSPDQWLDVMVLKKKESNTIEASINAGERLHVVLEEDDVRKRRNPGDIIFGTPFSGILDNKTCSVDKDASNEVDHKPLPFNICNDEFFVGGIPAELNHTKPEEFPPFTGIVASISINNELQDLYDFSVERHKDDTIQVSSRTASVSGSYHEVAWGRSNRLNLTCLHARTVCSPHVARWLFLDTTIKQVVKDKAVRSVDDGRVLKLVASADKDLRGFYTCRAHMNRRTTNIITYGVLGQIKYNLVGTDPTTCLAVITTLLLVVTTLGWLIYEGFHDLHTGFGFFRDAHFTPMEEAEAVCKYIDDNSHLIGSKTAIKLAKARARRRGQQLALASRSSFAAQEPQGLMQIENETILETTQDELENDESVTSEPKTLPPLPNEAPNNKMAYNVYRYEPTYTSTPRHGSVATPQQTRLSSSSSYDVASPRFVCNRLLLKRTRSSRESLLSKKSTTRSPKLRSDLVTIDSSTCAANVSPGLKVLQRFQQLRSDLD